MGKQVAMCCELHALPRPHPTQQFHQRIRQCVGRMMFPFSAESQPLRRSCTSQHIVMIQLMLNLLADTPAEKAKKEIGGNCHKFTSSFAGKSPRGSTCRPSQETNGAGLLRLDLLF